MEENLLTRLERPEWYPIPAGLNLEDLKRVNLQVLLLKKQGHALSVDQVIEKTGSCEIRICHYRSCQRCQEDDRGKVPAISQQA